jgi:Zn ribbon nucleic-acid-binding protein
MRPVDLHPAWLDYRRRSRTVLASLVTVPLLCGARASLEAVSGLPTVVHVVLAILATVLLASAAWLAAFRCPSCSCHFHWTWIVANPLARECLHCGFARWRDPRGPGAYGRR